MILGSLETHMGEKNSQENSVGKIGETTGKA
jgi:hypothetical protein